MKIIHYFLGFPPYRTGGLTKYAYDLMLAQKERGDEIIALWPGRISLIHREIGFKEQITPEGLKSIEILNPLPVSLDEGIENVIEFTRPCNPQKFIDLFSTLMPDAIHIHTLMGLHKELVDAANQLKIRTVFTTHDYFGICPKVTLYHDGMACEDDHSCRDCYYCNSTALSINKIIIMQSPLYRQLKDSVVVKLLRKKHRAGFYNEREERGKNSPANNENYEKYRKLRQYYKDTLERMDVIHFNSTLSKEVYGKYITPKESVVLSITHKEIADHRNESKKKWTGKLRITCLAPAKPYKGFSVLRNALDMLWNEGKRDFCLQLFSPVHSPSEYMIVHEDGFSQDELAFIFENTDVLVAPSVWYETFGFTVLEALSYGVPVIVSDHVGAKDIVKKSGIIVEAGNSEALKEAIAGLNEKTIQALRDAIDDIEIQIWKEFLIRNDSLYLNVIG